MSLTKKLKPSAKFCNILYILVAFVVVVITVDSHIEAKQVTLLPLTAQKVYQLLRKNDNLDAVPEGRVVTQGIAAVTGFTLGLKKAVGAALLYDIITANITEDATNQTTATPTYLTHEICFGSRGARSLYEAEAIAEAYSRLEEKDNTQQAAVRKSQEKRITKPKRNRRKKFNNRRRQKRPQRIKVIRTNHPETVAGNIFTGSDDATAASEHTGTQTTQPTAVNTATGALEETDLNAGTNTDTTSSTTTSTDNDQTLTCIVIQKPKQ